MEEGHNSGIAADQLRAIVERIERLSEERKAIADDISDVFKEARSSGFDVPALKMVIKERSQDPAKWQEREAIADLYRGALGAK